MPMLQTDRLIYTKMKSDKLRLQRTEKPKERGEFKVSKTLQEDSKEDNRKETGRGTQIIVFPYSLSHRLPGASPTPTPKKLLEKLAVRGLAWVAIFALGMATSMSSQLPSSRLESHPTL